ncbi:hypothetical protein RJ55_01489 [Drechmeria coniospora]|nr:hypothetical protein RJ55_01489 [Drechmeria coniospora]
MHERARSPRTASAERARPMASALAAALRLACVGAGAPCHPRYTRPVVHGITPRRPRHAPSSTLHHIVTVRKGRAIPRARRDATLAVADAPLGERLPSSSSAALGMRERQRWMQGAYEHSHTPPWPCIRRQKSASLPPRPPPSPMVSIRQRVGRR